MHRATLVHYLALTCAGEQLGDRLRARPAWRGAGEASFVEEQLRFNAWFRSYSGSPSIEVLDTIGVPIERTAARVDAWILNCVASPA